jgi:hypothetical protein
MAESISDPGGRGEMRGFQRIAIPVNAVARPISFAIAPANDVNVSEIIVRLTASPCQATKKRVARAFKTLQYLCFRLLSGRSSHSHGQMVEVGRVHWDAWASGGQVSSQSGKTATTSKDPPATALSPDAFLSIEAAGTSRPLLGTGVA